MQLPVIYNINALQNPAVSGQESLPVNAQPEAPGGAGCGSGGTAAGKVWPKASRKSPFGGPVSTTPPSLPFRGRTPRWACRQHPRQATPAPGFSYSLLFETPETGGDCADNSLTPNGHKQNCDKNRIQLEMSSWEYRQHCLRAKATELDGKGRLG